MCQHLEAHGPGNSSFQSNISTKLPQCAGLCWWQSDKPGQKPMPAIAAANGSISVADLRWGQASPAGRLAGLCLALLLPSAPVGPRFWGTSQPWHGARHLPAAFPCSSGALPYLWSDFSKGGWSHLSSVLSFRPSLLSSVPCACLSDGCENPWKYPLNHLGRKIIYLQLFKIELVVEKILNPIINWWKQN